MIPKTFASSAVFSTFNDCRISLLEVRRNGLHSFSIFNVVGIWNFTIIELRTLFEVRGVCIHSNKTKSYKEQITSQINLPKLKVRLNYKTEEGKFFTSQAHIQYNRFLKHFMLFNKIVFYPNKFFKKHINHAELNCIILRLYWKFWMIL